MNPLEHWKRMVVAGATAACWPAQAATEPAAPGGGEPPVARPNLVFIMADQWRGSALGFLGQEPVLTPRLDALARESLVLTRCVSMYPVCSPCRAIFMTGQFPHTNGVLANCNSDTTPFGYELKKDARCWSDVLKDQGYSLGYIGKWHLDSPHPPYIKTANNSPALAWNEWCPPDRRHGFDYWYAYGTYDRHLRPMYWSNNEPREGFHYVDQWGPEHEADQAIRYFKNEGGVRKNDQPFALVVSMNPPHTGYELVPDKYKKIYAGKTGRELLARPNVSPRDDHPVAKAARRDIANYYAGISGVDEQIGRILDALRETGLDKNTLVVFTSDHGNCIGSHDEPAKNVPWDEALLVPFIIRWPGHIPPRRDDFLFSVIDWAPTLLDVMGCGSAIPAAMQGDSRATLLKTGKGARPSSSGYICVPEGKPAEGRRGVRTARHTLVVSRRPNGKETIELYDNVADPYQMKDIAAEQPDLAQKLIGEELTPLLRKMNDPWLGKAAHP